MADWRLKIGQWWQQKALPFLTDKRTLLGLFLFVGFIASVTRPHSHNNFDIFCGVFHHVWNGLDLYAAYPEEYFDVNHYGPVFSLVIAPFALLPTWMGLLCWNMVLALALYLAVRETATDDRQHIFIVWFCAHELLTALFMQQFNVAIAAIILMSYTFIEREKEPWAAFLIILGTLVKLYGIVGIAFFFFSKHKGRFVGWLVVWSIILFVAPMLISSYSYIIDQYHGWYMSLIGKNDANQFSAMTNISLLGFIRKTGYVLTYGIQDIQAVMSETKAPNDCFWSRYSDLPVILTGMLMMAASLFLRVKQWKNPAYRLSFLASVMMFVCLFSTGTESSGYITALVGVAIWYTSAPWKRSGWDIFLMVFAFILTSMSPSDLFPRYLRTEFVRPMALKALPVIIIWLQLIFEMLTRDYDANTAVRHN